jgi:hypothetical protein
MKKKRREPLLPRDENMMNKPLAAAEQQIELERFMSTVAAAVTSALLLDYDGTLAPFSADRKRATPYPRITALLQEIMVSGKTRVVIITGRSAHEVISLLGIDRGLEVWGSHGFERLTPDGACEMPRVGSDVAQALSEAGRWLADHPKHASQTRRRHRALCHRPGPDPAARRLQPHSARCCVHHRDG